MTITTRRQSTLALILSVLVLILLGLVVDVVMTHRLSAAVRSTPACPAPPRQLACPALPLRFIADHPICADKLLRSMNVTNVRVLPRASPMPGWDEDATARWRDLAVRYLELGPGSGER